MYSVILMTALSTAPQTTEFNGYFRELFSFRGNSCRGGCHGSCTGSRTDYDDRPNGCTGSRARTGCTGSQPARAYAGGSCYGSCTGKVSAGSCTGMPSYAYSCSGGGYSQPPMMIPNFDGYAQPAPAVSYYVDSGSCFGNGGPAPFQFPSSPEYAPTTPVAPNSVNEDRYRPVVNDAARATVIVKLPTDAVLYAEGRKLNLTSDVRRFVSPPLPTNSDYTYNFRTEYTRNGEVITRTKSISVKAGGSFNLEFDESYGKTPMVTPQQMPMTAGRTTTASLPTVPEPAPSLPSIAPAKPTTPERAKIIVKLSPGATLFVDGKKNERSETTRDFTTPPLAYGQEFAYMMRAEIMRNGQPESQSMKVTFRAGEIQTVDLSQWPNHERAGR
jgi:uncharacterized protein (TIGR03000 family)